MAAYRGNDAEGTKRSIHLEDAGRTGHAVPLLYGVAVTFRNLLQDPVAGDHPGLPPLLPDGRHVLDKPDRHLPLQREGDKVENLVVIDPGHGNHVDLHRKTGRLRRIDPPQHPTKIRTAGDRGKGLGPERVQADIEALHPGGAQANRHLRQVQGIGGQHELLQPRDGGKLLQEGEDPLAHQRLAAGYPDLFYSVGNGSLGNEEQFLVTEDIGMPDQIDPLGRHAVEAAHVAAVGYRKAQIVDFSTE